MLETEVENLSPQEFYAAVDADNDMDSTPTNAVKHF